MSRRTAVKAAGRLYVASGVLSVILSLASTVGVAFGVYVAVQATDKAGRIVGVVIAAGVAVVWLFLLVFCYAMTAFAEHVMATHERSE